MRAQYELEYERNLTSALAAELEAEFEAAGGMRGFAGARRHSLADYEIIGNDDRVRVTNTLEIPFRFICCLEVLSGTSNEIRSRGTGTLISNRHVLTAAHNVDHNVPTSAFPINYVRPNHIFVAPARNDRNFPGHFSAVQTVRVSPVWQHHAARRIEPPNHSDWALLTLRTPLGTRQPNAPVTMQLPAPPLAWWSHRQFGGQTRIRAFDAAHWQRLRHESLNICGYAGDKCRHRPVKGSSTETDTCARVAVPGNFRSIAPPGIVPFVDWASTQWRSYGRIVNPLEASGLITYSIDTVGGHSGGPVWINWEGYRNLVGIHTLGRVTPTTNACVRITEPLLRQLRAWMRRDGVQPTF